MYACTPFSRMYLSGSRPPSSATTFTLNSSSVSSAMDFSAAAAPAVSGSKLTITCLVNRPRSRACSSVNAVPEVAMTFPIPAI